MNDDIARLFSSDELAELQAMTARIVQGLQARRDGLRHSHDEQGADGHRISAYRLVVGDRTILWVVIDHDLTVPTTPFGDVPAGTTGHAIRVQNADRTKTIETSGVALRGPHNDVDERTIQVYVVPRLPRWVAEFYGV